MLMEMITLLGGGLVRILPEALSIINKWQDNKHELALMDRQIELQQLKGDQELAHTELKGDIDSDIAEMNLHAEALRGQMTRTSIWIVDMLNFLVRPMTTYYFLGMYGLVKVGLLIIAYRYQQDFWKVLLEVYDDQDRAALWGILGFWFVGRVFEKQQSRAAYVPARHNGQF